MSYYNTTSQTSYHLRNAKDSAINQDERVLAFFKAFPSRIFSPWEVLDQLETTAPITSIRRSINTITKKGMLRKTNSKIDGPYGKPSYTWMLNNETSSEQLTFIG